MARKANKAADILELLNAGVPSGKIVKRLKASPSYVWKLKKEMAHKAEEVVKEEVKTPLNPVEKVLNSRSNADEDPLGKLLDQRASQ